MEASEPSWEDPAAHLAGRFAGMGGAPEGTWGRAGHPGGGHLRAAEVACSGGPVSVMHKLSVAGLAGAHAAHSPRKAGAGTRGWRCHIRPHPLPACPYNGYGSHLPAKPERETRGEWEGAVDPREIHRLSIFPSLSPSKGPVWVEVVVVTELLFQARSRPPAPPSNPAPPTAST